MLTLHYAPDNASLIIRLALLETGAPFRTALVDRRLRAQDSAAYRAVNPAGLIPALETPDGPVFETGACLLWLADRHPEAGLAPPPQAPGRGAFLSWLFFLSNTAHADLRRMFHPDPLPQPGAQAAQRAAVADRMRRHLGLLDRAAADHPGLFAPPSALAFYAVTLCRWATLYPVGGTGWYDAQAWPALRALAAAAEQRPATRAAALAEGLGPRPFTAPALPDPPDGSAT